MINKIKDIPNGTEVWVKMRREKGCNDDNCSLAFTSGYCTRYLDNNDEVLTEEQMRERFSENDGMPKQGDIIEVRDTSWSSLWKKETFVCMYEGCVVTDCGDKDFCSWCEWRFPPKKIQKTLAELEKELGYDEGTLEIFN